MYIIQEISKWCLKMVFKTSFVRFFVSVSILSQFGDDATTSSSWEHWWFSGRILACHAGGPGSIPGQCIALAWPVVGQQFFPGSASSSSQDDDWSPAPVS